MRAAGGPGATIYDATTPDLFDEPEDVPRFGPIFTATYQSDCESCDEGIVAGEDIRADGRGGWIHADDQCERVARG